MAITSIACDAEECVHNTGQGMCNKIDIYISSRECGFPECQDYKEREED